MGWVFRRGKKYYLMKFLNYVDIFSWLILHLIESVTDICYKILEDMEIFLYKMEFKV